ncbi:putative peptidoglycan lipid II flippase [Caloramator fervidus]|uniref:Probable lipid II flippase MurJ n=1 Tax=Caloramator fervidus TaxID=29344 RepID=A0A1H5SY74_9CLOT|nr:murein biosynthesis integral membrane protein MurJ [Caloramator fervidus]SEF55533.1 putative peptidoglycan lipid II flippase [Caloramator fervidus]
MEKESRIKKQAFLVTLIFFMSRVVGFIREMIIAKIFGRNSLTDAFFAAFTIPDVMYDLLVTGALSSGFMPVFNEHLAKDDEEGAWKAANTFITVALLFILAFNILYFALAKYIIPFVAIGNVKNPDTYNLTVKLTRIMTISVSFTVCAGLTMGILNSYKIFIAPALGPVLYNVGIIIGAIALGKKFGIYGLAFGVILGSMFNLSVQIPNFLKVGKRFRLELNLQNKSFRRMLKLMIPAWIGLGVLRINLVVNQNIASILDEGSITGLRYAQRIMLLPAIFGSGISTTIFPLLNTYVARQEYKEYKEAILYGIRILLFIIIPSTFGLIVLNYPIVRLLFKSGKFTNHDVAVTAFALAFYSIGIIGQCVSPILTRSFYALQDTETPVKIGIVIVIFNITLNLIFVKFSKLAIGGIALTSSLGSIFQCMIAYTILQKRVGKFNNKRLLTTFVKVMVSSIVMALIVKLSYGYISNILTFSEKINDLISVSICVFIGVLVYFFMTLILKVEEVNAFVDIIKRKLSKK